MLQTLAKSRLLLSQAPTAARVFSSKINQHYIPNKPEYPPFNPKDNKAQGLSSNHRSEDWTLDEVMKSTEEHVIFTWNATDPMRKGAKDFKRGEGIYLYDYAGNKYIDFSSQAINNNLGYSIPDQVLAAITKQLTTLP
jgi:4-aminobutyrate aminotransferase-like enzyme